MHKAELMKRDGDSVPIRQLHKLCLKASVAQLIPQMLGNQSFISRAASSGSPDA
jgi:hypothetical protein